MKTVFMGTGEIGLPAFRWLLDSDLCEVIAVYTQPDRPVGRKQLLTPPEVKTVALERGIPVFQPGKLREESATAELLALAPDLIVVMAYGQILTREVIDLPPVACINLHASILPRHRGASPIQGAIRDGDEESGITVMHIDIGLDSGDIVHVERCPITAQETGGSLHDKLAEISPAALSKAVEMFAAGTAQRRPQDESLVTHDRKLLREHGEIDWTRNATEIERLIRAYDPWPGTFTKVAGQKLKILPFCEAHPGSSSKPGEVVGIDADGLRVACGIEQLLIREVQLEGRKRMSVASFLAGNSDLVRIGTQLG
ncbi:MAG: methionyl-tRNA formyltransferase [Verrucomicrobiales bacterium]